MNGRRPDSGQAGQTEPAGRRASPPANRTTTTPSCTTTCVRTNGAQADARRDHRDLEARSLHLHLGVAGRDDEATAQRDLGDVRFQRPALDVEALGRAERGQADARRGADAQPCARVEREQEMAGARHAHGRSGGDPIAAGRGPNAVRRLDRGSRSLRRRRPPASSRAGASLRGRPPAVVPALAGSQATPADRQQHRGRRGRHAPPDPRRRDDAVHGRGARARSPRRSPFDPAASSPFPLRRRPRPARAPWPRGARTARVLLGSPHPLPLRPFQLGRQFGIRGDARMQILAPADQTALGRRGADRHDLGHLAQVVTVHVVEQEGPGAPRIDVREVAAHAVDRRTQRHAMRGLIGGDGLERQHVGQRPGARPCGGECACRRRARRAWRSRRRAGTRRGNDRSSARPPPSSAGPDPDDPDRSAPAGD